VLRELLIGYMSTGATENAGLENDRLENDGQKCQVGLYELNSAFMCAIIILIYLSMLIIMIMHTKEPKSYSYSILVLGRERE